MRLADWRKAQSLSCAEVENGLGLEGVRDGKSVWNWETGRSRADADMIDRIKRFTNSEVTEADMHQTRLDWLRAHRPERFAHPIAEAAE